MKVLVADKFEKSGLDGLQQLGCEVVSEPSLEGEALEQALLSHSPRVLVVRGTKVSGAATASPGLGLIIRAGAGYNTIDTSAAESNGVWVANCPGKNAAAVAELAMGLVVSLDRRIPDNVATLRSGIWDKARFSKAAGLAGSSIGIVGWGMIGKEMAKRTVAFDMPTIVYSRYAGVADVEAHGCSLAASLGELAERCRTVSVHCSLNSDTRGSIDRGFFDKMQEGGLFVNTSRAEVVVEADLIAAVKSGRIRAAVDVFENEPSGGTGTYDGPLKDLDGVYVTHHIGASTEQAQEAVASETVRIVQVFMANGSVENAVNNPVQAPV